MALSKLRKQQLAQMSIPEEAEMRQRVISFQRRSGMTVQDLADEVGTSASVVYMFLRGTYYAEATVNSLNLRAKLKEYIDLHDVELHDTLRGTHVDTSDYRRIREACLHAMAEGVMYTIDGAPGMQKSWALLTVAKEINQSGRGKAVYVYARGGQTPHSFLRELCTAAGLPERGNIDQLIRKMRHFLAKDRVVLLIDEGNHLAVDTMEVVRQLLDLPPYFGVVTAGTHEYALRLNNWNLEQLRSRNRETLVLTGHSREEARAILFTRLGMSAGEADEVIVDCLAKATRSHDVDGRLVKKEYSYISSRLLFGFIQGVEAEAQEAA